MAKKIRTRMPPSPTGNMHIGTAFTGIFNWLFARHNEGEFIVRIEDTDRERSEKKYEENILDGLRWLGLDWDEFYRQSERTEIYKKYINQLLDDKKAFWCYHTKDEIEAEHAIQQENKQAPRHICNHKNRDSLDDSKGVIRLDTTSAGKRFIEFKDILRGDISFDQSLFGDISIARATDDPLYHIAVVVDDYEMVISHVVRGEDHIANTPKQILIQEALGFDRPEYLHFSMMLATDRSKLSKRHGAISLTEYRDMGYLPEAMLNYLVLLGYTPEDEKEIVDRESLTKHFDLSKMHLSGSVFDIKKLDWVNGEYIKKLSDSDIVSLVKDRVEKKYKSVSDDYLLQILPMLKERMKKISDVDNFDFLFQTPDYDAKVLNWKDSSSDQLAQSLIEVKEIFNSVGVGDIGNLKSKLDELGKKYENRGLVYWPLRVALTGLEKSPDPIDISVVLGKDEVVNRINKAIHKLTNE